MRLKMTITAIVEAMTGRRCSSCDHNRGGRCCHPSGTMFMKFWHSVTHPGYEHSESVHYSNTAGAAAKEGLQAGMDAGLTEEEQYQLQKIKASLQEAENTARDCGLLKEE